MVFTYYSKAVAYGKIKLFSILLLEKIVPTDEFLSTSVNREVKAELYVTLSPKHPVNFSCTEGIYKFAVFYLVQLDSAFQQM